MAGRARVTMYVVVLRWSGVARTAYVSKMVWTPVGWGMGEKCCGGVGERAGESSFQKG